MKLHDKCVLVTGADGFIGSHLAEMLLGKCAKVRVLVQYNSQNSWGWLDESDKKNEFEVMAGDIRDPFFVRKLVKGTDMVFNLAALIAIPYSYQAPASYVETNIGGALNVCQAALEAGVQKVIQTSTSEVYGTAQYVPIDEKHPLQPQSPYSASKISADAIAMSFYHAFGLPVTIARPFNTYGPRQSARAIIPSIIIQLAAGKKKIRLGDLRPTRDFNYVSNTCGGLIALAGCKKAAGETVNIGSNTETGIKTLYDRICRIMNRRAAVEKDLKRMRPAGSEVFRLKCDGRKLKKLTGYEPAVGLDEGLKKTVEWFLEDGNLKKYKAGIYNV